jgi:PKD repeat protein
MKKLQILLIGILLCGILIAPVSATYTDAIGFKWDTSSDSPTLTRVFANGTTASVDGDYFNNHAIWGGIKKVLVNRTTGAVTYGTNNRGDGLDLTGTGGNQVMVEYPMFYTFESYNAPFLTYIVSPTQYNSSFVVHPMFYQRGDGTPAAHYYVGAYEMQTEDVEGTLVGTSYTGKTPVVSQNIGTMRTYAERNGPRWGIMNVWTGSGLRELLYIETGTLNSQIAWAKSRGVVDDTAAKSAGADSADTNIFATNATGGGTGINGKTPEVWRALENSIGNVWEFWDGQNSYTSGGNSIWRNINRTGLNLTGGQTKFQDLLIAGDYETSTTATIADGFQTSVATGAADRLLMIPTGREGTETTYLSDYFWYPRSTNAGNPNVLFAGGGWDYAGVAGAGAWASNVNASLSYAFIGARLEFRPSGAIASFTTDKTTGPTPLTVQFTDTSTNYPDAWNWSVNDTAMVRTWYNYTSSTNLIQTFTNPGIYNVSLSVQDMSTGSPISTYAKDITAYSIEDHDPVVVTNPYYVVYMWKRIA